MDQGEPPPPGTDGDRVSVTRVRSQGYVDYEGVAALYRRGRSLPVEVLDRWGDAARPYLPAGLVRVVDVGAGTGAFAQAWPQWGAARVTAVEPAAAMTREANVTHPAVSYVRGVAEALPLRAGCSDVVWVSTALHHFADLDRAVRDFGRVLAAGGRVLVRTYVPGRTEITYADEFPGRSKWVRRFHTTDELLHLFGAHGFDLVDVREVLEWTETYALSAQWVSLMRNADSTFTVERQLAEDPHASGRAALSDDEIAQGLDVLHANPDKVGRLELTLLVFEWPGARATGGAAPSGSLADG